MLTFHAVDSCIGMLGRTSARMEGLEATGSVEDDPKVTGKWRSESGGARFRVNLCKRGVKADSRGVNNSSYAPGS